MLVLDGSEEEDRLKRYRVLIFLSNFYPPLGKILVGTSSGQRIHTRQRFIELIVVAEPDPCRKDNYFPLEPNYVSSTRVE